MRTKILGLVIYMCSALLFMQWTGTHLHVDIGSHDFAPHASQLHGLDPHDDDHGAEVDVQVFELSAGWFKLIQFFVFTVLLLLTAVIVGQAILAPKFQYSSYQRPSFWRPILRAPPISR